MSTQYNSLQENFKFSLQDYPSYIIETYAMNFLVPHSIVLLVN